MSDEEKKNARDFPLVWYARHMESGLCGYEKEKILVDADAMKNMAPSFPGKPVYLGHQTVDVDKIQEQADGYVADCFYNKLDGWLWSKIIVVSDRANDALRRGWSVSNAYVPSEFASGGEHHAVAFDRKIVNAIFTHLAIVENPRYEGAKVFTPDDYKDYCTALTKQLEQLENSKGAKKMFKGLFKNSKTEVTKLDEIDDNTMVELQNGKSVSLKDMIETVTNAKPKKNSDDKEDKGMLNADTEVDVGGEKMPLGHLMNKYMNAQKENEAKEKEEKEAEEKKNAEEEEKEEKEKKNAEDKKKEDEEKKNSKEFEEMKNAKNKKDTVIIVDTPMDQAARGKANYGSGK